MGNVIRERRCCNKIDPIYDEQKRIVYCKSCGTLLMEDVTKNEFVKNYNMYRWVLVNRHKVAEFFDMRKYNFFVYKRLKDVYVFLYDDCDMITDEIRESALDIFTAVYVNFYKNSKPNDRNYNYVTTTDLIMAIVYYLILINGDKDMLERYKIRMKLTRNNVNSLKRYFYMISNVLNHKSDNIMIIDNLLKKFSDKLDIGNKDIENIRKILGILFDRYGEYVGGRNIRVVAASIVYLYFLRKYSLPVISKYKLGQLFNVTHQSIRNTVDFIQDKFEIVASKIMGGRDD